MHDSPSQSGWEDVNELGWSDHRGGPSSSSRLGMTDEGKGPRRGGKQRRYPGRLPPVVSSLFSITAAHLKRWYQRHGAGSKGYGADGGTAQRSPRKRLRLTRGR